MQGVAVYNKKKNWIKTTTDTAGHFELSNVTGGFRCPPMMVIADFKNYDKAEVKIPAGAQQTISMQQSGSKNTVAETSSATPAKESVPDPVVQFLLASAATDFNKHLAKVPDDFRNLEVGYLLSSGNEKFYVLCGEYLVENKWSAFATIKTSDYEHYLGGDKQISYCRDAVKVLTGDTKLATELKRKLDELTNNHKSDIQK